MIGQAEDLRRELSSSVGGEDCSAAKTCRGEEEGSDGAGNTFKGFTVQNTAGDKSLPLGIRRDDQTS